MPCLLCGPRWRAVVARWAPSRLPGRGGAHILRPGGLAPGRRAPGPELADLTVWPPVRGWKPRGEAPYRAEVTAGRLARPGSGAGASPAPGGGPAAAARKRPGGSHGGSSRDRSGHYQFGDRRDRGRKADSDPQRRGVADDAFGGGLYRYG